MHNFCFCFNPVATVFIPAASLCGRGPRSTVGLYLSCEIYLKRCYTIIQSSDRRTGSMMLAQNCYRSVTYFSFALDGWLGDLCRFSLLSVVCVFLLSVFGAICHRLRRMCARLPPCPGVVRCRQSKFMSRSSVSVLFSNLLGFQRIIVPVRASCARNRLQSWELWS